MKLPFLIQFLFFQSVICFSQGSHPSIINLGEKNNITGKIDTITEKEFTKNGKPLPWTNPKVNDKIDSISIYLTEQYPEAFGVAPQCIYLNGTKEQVAVCNVTTSPDTNEWWTYTTDDYQNGFLFFHERGPGADVYTLFNPESRLIKSVRGYPNFIGTQAIYSVSGTKGNYSFAFESLENDNYFELSFNGCMITNYYYKKNEFYFEVVAGEKKESKRHIRLRLV